MRQRWYIDWEVVVQNCYERASYTTDLSMLYEMGQLVLGGRAVWALLCSSMGGKWKVSGGKLKGAFDP